jgi:hypothetical protein
MRHLSFVAAAVVLGSTAFAQNVCTSTVAATSCGPTLTATFTPVGNAGNHTIELSCSGLDPNGIGLMTWGLTQVNIPFPTCPMLNDFIWGHVVNLDATGSHTWSRSWPNSVQGYYYVQFGSIVIESSGAFVLRTTDSIRIECQR